ncbi:hypothetical protein HMPREF9141_0784 [Prevotella multiformis DSM 16608]|uniref:Uncharacterized protein n=1 Tax=Prevotella multiformis DSM 16608 TaxID=888743 RepID=F0F5B8_9BACT|nr:hypothetical protein HMPREF9141_0784 [Prevotella multiformis DSM 16608]
MHHPDRSGHDHPADHSPESRLDGMKARTRRPSSPARKKEEGQARATCADDPR